MSTDDWTKNDTTVCSTACGDRSTLQLLKLTVSSQACATIHAEDLTRDKRRGIRR